jgi:hypothetical protein
MSSLWIIFIRNKVRRKSRISLITLLLRGSCLDKKSRIRAKDRVSRLVIESVGLKWIRDSLFSSSKEMILGRMSLLFL